MDLGNPWSIFSGLVLGLIGMALLIYGKKQMDLRCIVGGLALCVLPYFVVSLLVLWGLSVAVLGGLWAWAKYLG